MCYVTPPTGDDSTKWLTAGHSDGRGAQCACGTEQSASGHAPIVPTRALSSLLGFVACAAQNDGMEIDMYCEEREAALILDTQGRVVHCSTAAKTLLGQHADAMIDLPVKAVFPKLPMSAQTPGYNLAYAAMHGTHNHWMLHWAQTLGGHCIGLKVRFGRVKMKGELYIALTLSADLSVRAAAPLLRASARCA